MAITLEVTNGLVFHDGRGYRVGDQFQVEGTADAERLVVRLGVCKETGNPAKADVTEMPNVATNTEASGGILRNDNSATLGGWRRG